MNVADLLQQHETGLQRILESMDPEFKKNIFSKWNLNSFEDTSFLNDCSMKRYTKLHYF